LFVNDDDKKIKQEEYITKQRQVTSTRRRRKKCQPTYVTVENHHLLMIFIFKEAVAAKIGDDVKVDYKVLCKLLTAYASKESLDMRTGESFFAAVHKQMSFDGC
jgi:hypothetical protein